MIRQFTYIGSFLILLFLSSCHSTYIITKSISCHDAKFTPAEITEITDTLNQFIPTKNYQLKKLKHILKLKSKNKELAKKLQSSINYPSVVFRKIAMVETFNIGKVYIPLSMNKKFNFINENDTFNRQQFILGFVENEADLIQVTQDLEKQGCVLSEENLFWSYRSTYFDRKNLKRLFLVAMEQENELEIPTTPEFLADVKALIDSENFEPSIRLILNECGQQTFEQIFKDKDFSLNSVFIDDRFYASQIIRIRPQNEICIFGFRTLEEAKNIANLLKRQTLHIRVSKD